MARRALILANEIFNDPAIPSLQSPSHDGQRLSDLLARSDVGGYAVEYVVNSNSVEARVAVQSFFRSAKAEDFNLLLISGHGIRDSQGHLHFATSDTRNDLLAATSLDAAFVIKQMDLCAAAKQIAVIDTCFSGAFVHGMVSKSAVLRISRTDFDNAEIDNIRGRAVITASTHVQAANENKVDGLTQSVFTRHFIEGISSGAADADGDGEISLPELFDYISAKLKAEGSVQTPRLYDYGLAGRAMVAKNPAYKPAALPVALVKRLVSKSKAQKLMAIEQLQDIAVSTDPAAGLAVDALNKLLRDDYAIVQTMARDTLDSLGKDIKRENAGAETVAPEPQPAETKAEPPKPSDTLVNQPVVEPPPTAASPPPPQQQTDPLDSMSTSRNAKKLMWLGVSVATIIALIVLYGIVKQMEKARDEVALAAAVDAAFEETAPAAEGAAAAADTAGPDANQVTAGLRGKWALADSSECGNPAISITVSGPELKINEQNFNRDLTTVDANGWMKIGDGFYKLSDANTLLIVDNLERVSVADKFKRCA